MATGNLKWGSAVRKLREKEGFSTTDVTSTLGITKGQLSNYEMGRSRIPEPIYNELASMLPGVPSIPNAPICASRTNGRKKSSKKVKRMRVKQDPGLKVRTPKGKSKKVNGPKVSIGFMHTVFSLFKDRKSLSRIKGLLAAATEEGMSIEELSQLLDATA